MTDWKLITENDNGLEVQTENQIDEVGNIYQRAGGVIPKACQKCKTEFNAKIKSTPLTQTVGMYTCSCKFKTGDPTEAFDHQLATDHVLKKDVKHKTVSYINILEGLKANIRKVSKDSEVIDIIILCDNCVD